jgi:uncharacterized protein DUF4234
VTSFDGVDEAGRLPRTWWWAAASTGAMAIGAFGPWVTVLGTLTARGTDDGAGWKVVGSAVVAAVALGLLARWRKRWICVVPLLAAVLGIAISAYNLYDISTYSDTVLGAKLEEAEWGLYVALLGSSSLALAVLVVAAQLPRGNSRAEVTITGSEATARIRNPWAVFGLAIATFGIYYLYWYYQANRELKDFGVGRHPVVSVLAIVPGALLIVPPFVSWWRFVSRLQEAEVRAGAPGRIDHGLAIALYVVGVFLLPIELVYTQQHLNDVWRQLRRPEPPAASTAMLSYAPEPRTAPEA